MRIDPMCVMSTDIPLKLQNLKEDCIKFILSNYQANEAIQSSYSSWVALPTQLTKVLIEKNQTFDNLGCSILVINKDTLMETSTMSFTFDNLDYFKELFSLVIKTYDMKKQLKKLIESIPLATNEFELKKIQTEYQMLKDLNSEIPSIENEDIIMNQEYNKSWHNYLKIFEENTHLFVQFGNFILQDKFLTLNRINETFTNGVLVLNTNFFNIGDADLCNFKNQII